MNRPAIVRSTCLWRLRIIMVSVVPCVFPQAPGAETFADSVADAVGGDMSDFPAHLRRPRPVADIREAAVFSINEFTRSGGDVDRARKVGSDVLIRGWFKWAQAPPVAEYRSIPEKVHALGALLGGGITCSALYDGENDISRDELLDMATRNPAGDLVDAWGQKGIRHGSLSSPRYLDELAGSSWGSP